MSDILSTTFASSCIEETFGGLNSFFNGNTINKSATTTAMMPGSIKFFLDMRLI